jgi:hypothetical protein
MQATKYTVTVRMEMLSLDCVPSLLADAQLLLSQEINSANLSHDDGDCVTVLIEQVKVTI